MRAEAPACLLQLERCQVDIIEMVNHLPTVNITSNPESFHGASHPLSTFLIIRADLHANCQCGENQCKHVRIFDGVAFCVAEESLKFSFRYFVRYVWDIASLRFPQKHVDTSKYVVVRAQQSSGHFCRSVTASPENGERIRGVFRHV